jgi:hypothetical protein
MPPLETLLGATDPWRPTARGGGWATAAALLLLLAAHLSVHLVRRYRRGRLIRPETAAATPASSAAVSPSPGSSTGSVRYPLPLWHGFLFLDFIGGGD